MMTHTKKKSGEYKLPEYTHCEYEVLDLKELHSPFFTVICFCPANNNMHTIENRGKLQKDYYLKRAGHFLYFYNKRFFNLDEKFLIFGKLCHNHGSNEKLHKGHPFKYFAP